MKLGAPCKAEVTQQVLNVHRGRTGKGRRLFELAVHALGNEQRLGILREQGDRAHALAEPPALEFFCLGEHGKKRRLAATVAAHDRVDAAGADIDIESAQHPALARGVPEPRTCERSRKAAFVRKLRRRCGAALRKQAGAYVERRHVGKLGHMPVLQLKGAGRVLEHRPRAMRRHHDRAAQLAVHAKERVQKGLLGNGVELRRRLVEQKQARSHGERGGKREQLLLSARERVGLGVEPVLDTKEIAGLGHATAHLVLRCAEVLETEGHLVPHGIAHDLVLGILEHIPDRARRLRVRELLNRPAECPDRPRALPRRRDLRLAEREQGRLARARTAHEQRERPVGDRPRAAIQNRRRSIRV